MKNNLGKVKHIFAERGIGFYLTVPAIVFAVLALVFYRQNGVTEFNPELNGSAIVCLIVGIALSVVEPWRRISFLTNGYPPRQSPLGMWHIWSNCTLF